MGSAREVWASWFGFMAVQLEYGDMLCLRGLNHACYELTQLYF